MPWLRHFALFVVFVAALFRPAAAGAFVSAPDANAQARVGAFELVAATLVGPSSGAACGLHEGIGAAYDENASGYRFAAKGPFEIAKEGGKHAGFLKNYQGRSGAEIQKGIGSIEKQIAEHQAKIANPEKFIPDWAKLDPRQQQALVNQKWPSDIQRQTEQLEILKALLGGGQ